MYQNQGYNIQIDDFVTAGTTGLDFNGDGVTEVTGSVNKTAAIAGGQIIIDAPDSFLISSDDTDNTILVGTRASLEVAGANSVPTDYQDLTFDVTRLNGTTQTITLARSTALNPG